MTRVEVLGRLEVDALHGDRRGGPAAREFQISIDRQVARDGLDRLDRVFELNRRERPVGLDHVEHD